MVFTQQSNVVSTLFEKKKKKRLDDAVLKNMLRRKTMSSSHLFEANKIHKTVFLFCHYWESSAPFLHVL